MKITIPAPDALYLANAMLPVIPAEEWTPVLQRCECLIERGKLIAFATDRYRIHEVTLEATVTGKREQFGIPRDALRWIIATARVLTPHRNDRDTATLEISVNRGSDLKLTLVTGRGTAQWSHVLPVGNFPPVRKLMDEAEKAPTHDGPRRLGTKFLADLDKLARHRDDGDIRYTADAPSGEPHKPGMVLATFEGARAAIMPRIVRFEGKES